MRKHFAKLLIAATRPHRFRHPPVTIIMQINAIFARRQILSEVIPLLFWRRIDFSPAASYNTPWTLRIVPSRETALALAGSNFSGHGATLSLSLSLSFSRLFEMVSKYFLDARFYPREKPFSRQIRITFATFSLNDADCQQARSTHRT